jgi:hypothetical protein
MLDEDDIRKVAQVFQDKGLGLVVVYAWSEGEDFKVKCFSSISSKEAMNIMDGVSANASLMPFDRSAMMNGEMIVKPPDDGLCEAVEWAATIFEKEEPLIVAAIGEDVYSAYAVGDVPMIVYLATRIITSIKRQNPSFDVRNFNPSLN